MKKLTVCVLTTVLLSACHFEPVLTAAKKHETLLSPIGFILIMVAIVVFSLRPHKQKKKLKH